VLRLLINVHQRALLSNNRHRCANVEIETALYADAAAAEAVLMLTPVMKEPWFIIQRLLLPLCCRWLPNVMTPWTWIMTRSWTEPPLKSRRATKATRLANSSARCKTRSSSCHLSVCRTRCLTMQQNFVSGCWPTHPVRPPSALSQRGKRVIFLAGLVGC